MMPTFVYHSADLVVWPGANSFFWLHTHLPSTTVLYWLADARGSAFDRISSLAVSAAALTLTEVENHPHSDVKSVTDTRLPIWNTPHNYDLRNELAASEGMTVGGAVWRRASCPEDLQTNIIITQTQDSTICWTAFSLVMGGKRASPPSSSLYPPPCAITVPGKHSRKRQQYRTRRRRWRKKKRKEGKKKVSGEGTGAWNAGMSRNVPGVSGCFRRGVLFTVIRSQVHASRARRAGP